MLYEVLSKIVRILPTIDEELAETIIAIDELKLSGEDVTHIFTESQELFYKATDILEHVLDKLELFEILYMEDL